MALRDNLYEILRQAARYFAVLRWTVQESFWRLRGETLWILVCATLAFVNQAAAIGLTYWYINLLQEGGVAEFYGHSFDAHSSVFFLGLIVFLVVGLMGIGAAATYYGRSRAIRFGRIHEEHCAKTAIALASHLPNLSCGFANSVVFRGNLRQIVAIDARYCGITARLLAQGLPMMLGFIVASFALLVIDPAVTVVVGFISIFVFLMQYPANLGGAKASQAWETSRGSSLKEYVETFDIMNRLYSPLSAQSYTVEQLFERKHTKNMLGALESRLRAVELGTLTTQLGGALILAAVIFILGARALGPGEANWAVLVAYLGVLRICLGFFVGMGRSITSISRLYPQVARLIDFVHSARRYRVPPAVTGLPVSLHLPIPSLDGTVAELELKPGGRLAIIAPAHLRGEVLFALALAFDKARIEGSQELAGDVAGVGIRSDLAGETPRAAFRLPDELQVQDLVARLAKMGVMDQALSNIMQLDHPFHGTWEQAIAPRTVVALQLISALERGAPVLVIDRAAVDLLGPHAWAWAEPQLDNRITAIRCTPEEAKLDMGESVALACDAEAVHAWVPLTPGGLSEENLARLIGKVRRPTKKADILLSEDEAILG